MRVAKDQLKRDSAIPLYFQLQEVLKEKIEMGSWIVGQMIPSEPKLCQSYQVSRTVVRQALSVLEQDGQLRRVRGKGTFVSPPKLEQRVGGLSRLLAYPIPGHESLVLDYQEELPPKWVSEKLEMRANAKIIRVMTLLRSRGVPLALLDSFFPLAAADPYRKHLRKELPFTLASTAQMRDIGLTRTRVGIETSFCSPWEAEQLQVPVQGAVFVTLCTEYRKEGREEIPFEVVRGVYRVDLVQLRFDVSTNSQVPNAFWQMTES
jgi:GntR family transcriptional regulator